MSIIQFPDRRSRALEPIHPTAPRVGIFAIAARRQRSVGPQAHLHCYIADEDRAIWRQVLRALAAFWCRHLRLRARCSVPPATRGFR